jgi:hypothetical protein
MNAWATPNRVVSSTPSVSPSYSHDAMVNFSDGGFSQAGQLLAGQPQPWFVSPVVQNFYGGIPDLQQRADFTRTVLDRVSATYAQSGIPVKLTADPDASAAHVLSVVSGATAASNPGAAGITTMGGDGFSFVDRMTYAKTLDELQWALSRNIAHELMHAFHVDHYDTTGDFLDSGTASWDLLVASDTMFSPQAINELMQQDFRSRGAGTGLGAQNLHGSSCKCAAHLQLAPVPEPATWLAWGLAAVAGWTVRRRMVRRIA